MISNAKELPMQCAVESYLSVCIGNSSCMVTWNMVIESNCVFLEKKYNNHFHMRVLHVLFNAHELRIKGQPLLIIEVRPTIMI